MIAQITRGQGAGKPMAPEGGHNVLIAPKQSVKSSKRHYISYRFCGLWARGPKLQMAITVVGEEASSDKLARSNSLDPYTRCNAAILDSVPTCTEGKIPVP